MGIYGYSLFSATILTGNLGEKIYITFLTLSFWFSLGKIMIITFLTLAFYFSSGKILIISFLTLAFYFFSGKILIISFLTLAFYFFSGKIRIVKANWVYSHIFKLTHPPTKFSGSENGHIREKMDCHIHWMSELRTYDLYIMVW